MKISRIWALGIVVIGCWAGRGEAAQVPQVLYDSAGFLQGQQAFSQSFDISGPGTLTVTLTNLTWPEQLAGLDLVMATSEGLLGPEMGAGSETFKVTGGRYFADWFGEAQGPLGLGVYCLEIKYYPQGFVPVPLPPSMVLFLSGLLLFAWQGRTKVAANLIGRRAAAGA